MCPFRAKLALKMLSSSALSSSSFSWSVPVLALRAQVPTTPPWTHGVPFVVFKWDVRWVGVPLFDLLQPVGSTFAF